VKLAATRPRPAEVAAGRACRRPIGADSPEKQQRRLSAARTAIVLGSLSLQAAQQLDPHATASNPSTGGHKPICVTAEVRHADVASFGRGTARGPTRATPGTELLSGWLPYFLLVAPQTHCANREGNQRTPSCSTQILLTGSECPSESWCLRNTSGRKPHRPTFSASSCPLTRCRRAFATPLKKLHVKAPSEPPQRLPWWCPLQRSPGNAAIAFSYRHVQDPLQHGSASAILTSTLGKSEAQVIRQTPRWKSQRPRKMTGLGGRTVR